MCDGALRAYKPILEKDSKVHEATRGNAEERNAYSFGLSADPQLFSSGALEGPRDHKQTTCRWHLCCAIRMEWVMVSESRRPAFHQKSAYYLGSGWCAFCCQGGLANAESRSRRPCSIFCAGKKKSTDSLCTTSVDLGVVCRGLVPACCWLSSECK